MLAGSLRPGRVPPPSGLELLPPQPGLTAHDRLVEAVPLGRLVAVVVVAVPFSPLLAARAGSALAQLAPRSRLLLAGRGRGRCAGRG